MLCLFRICRRRAGCIQLFTLWRSTVTVEFLAVMTHDLVILAVARPLDLPVGEITKLRQLIERRTQCSLDERFVSVLLDVEKLAELVVTLFVYTVAARDKEARSATTEQEPSRCDF